MKQATLMTCLVSHPWRCCRRGRTWRIGCLRSACCGWRRGIESAYRNSGARTFLLTAVSLTTDIAPYVDALTRKFGDIGVGVVVATTSEMLSGGDAATEPSLQLSEGYVGANMARLKTGHGLVLIESEALLNCGQTEYVARCADATILMVESGVTTRPELLRAAQLLERMQVTGIGAVLAELQLRLADTGFRTAIESLERRQSQRTRPLRVAERPLDQDPPLQEEELPAEPVVEVEFVEQVAEEVATAAEEPAAVGTPVIEDVVEAQTASIRRGFGAVAATGPVLVETEAVPVERVWEDEEEEPVMAAANGTMHEQGTARLSTRRDVQGSREDVDLTRKTSWLGRLLGRDQAPTFSIIPEEYEQDETPQRSVPTLVPVAARSPENSEEDDALVASRLKEVSRVRPVAPPAATVKTRLQIVPDVPAEQIPESSFNEVAETELMYAEVATPQPIAATPEVTEPLLRPRRPMSFQELNDKLAEVAPVPVESEQHEPLHELIEPEAAVEETARPDEPSLPVEAAPVEAATVEARLEPMHMGPLHVEPDRTQWNQQEPVAEEQPAALAPAHVEPDYLEPAPWEAVSERKIAKSYYDSEEVGDLRPFDIEPAYEEASRHLAGGRWDPIPPLRSTGDGWRDRLSPVPASNYRPASEAAFGYESSREAADPARRRWTGKDEDVARWVPEPPAGVATQTEPLPEPILTRQWALLSKFQQARASGSHPVASEPASGEPAFRGYDDREPKAANGSGRRQS